MSSLPSSPGLQGTLQPSDAASQFNAQAFVVRSLLSKLATGTLVRVMGVTNDGGLSPVGLVDVQPLVNQLDGAGAAVPHGTIYGCPYLRLQGGANAVILDPQVGDIGAMVFASRDITGVIAAKDQANPGSGRMYSWSDGMYFGGLLNGEPSQFVQFNTEGITIKSPTQVKLDAPSVDIECQTLVVNASTSATVNTPTFTVNGNVVNNGNVLTSGNTHVEGTTLLDGVLTCDGAALLNDVLAVTGVANFSGGVFDGATSIGVGHRHGHGTIALTGNTDVVIP